jgi:hypothetical protein
VCSDRVEDLVGGAKNEGNIFGNRTPFDLPAFNVERILISTDAVEKWVV